jgi:endonuclease/exonuclease/phosphatase family metal-dependent hydrolase
MPMPGMSAHEFTRSGDLRVATLNLWARFGDWPARRGLLQAGLRALAPDLVAFQEAVVSDGYDQVNDLLGSGWQVVYSAAREGEGSATALASRWPLGAVHEVDLNVTPRTADFPCTTLVAEVDAPDPVGPLLFASNNPNYQLPFERERELQAVTTARFIERLVGERDLHVVLAGDFDAMPEQASVRFWCGRQSLESMSVCYRNAWEAVHPDEPGHTFTPHNPLVGSLRNQFVVDGEVPVEPGRRIDHIMVRCGRHGPSLHIVGCARIFDEPVGGVWASDHFGVVADLAAPRPAP